MLRDLDGSIVYAHRMQLNDDLRDAFAAMERTAPPGIVRAVARWTRTHEPVN
jgi:hypothetical protein